MDRNEQRLREQIARAKGGHKRKFEAQLEKLISSRSEEAPAEEVKAAPKAKKAPAKKKKATKKKAE
tara:strand:- start:155 stop:352 length:198 start_codon:yes stop_codon:yes gene_type:complete